METFVFLVPYNELLKHAYAEYFIGTMLVNCQTLIKPL